MVRAVVLALVMFAAVQDVPAAAQDGQGPVSELVRAGDAIRVRLWVENEDIKAEYPVDEQGYVVLPRLGRREVGGSSHFDVRARLMEELSDVFPNTAVDVTVLRHVLVRGAVRQPGRYLLESYAATVGDALAAAEGVLPSGRTNLVRLVRGESVLPIQLGGTIRLGSLPLQSGDELVVPERAWLTREPAILAAIVTSFATLAVTLIAISAR